MINMTMALTAVSNRSMTARIWEWLRESRVSSTLGHALLVLPVSPDLGRWIRSRRRFATCQTEAQWSALSRLKEDSVLRAFQIYLCDCGLNSTRARAWPFRSHTVDTSAREGLAEAKFARCTSLQ